MAALTFLPQSAPQLTVFDSDQQIYLSHCPSLTSVTHSPKENNSRLKSPFTLLNWNIYKQRKLQWQDKLQEWSADADLLTLQEVQYSPAFILFSEAANFFHLQNFAFKYNGFIYGVNTLSKHQAAFVCGSRASEPWMRVPKTGIASSYTITDHSDLLLLINLHGVNFTFSALPLKEQLQVYIDLINGHQGAIIFSGDFNTWSDARMAAITEIFSQLGFSEVIFNKDQRTTVFGLPLDHIYFRGLKVLKAQSLATDASDHSPQLVTFAID